MIMVMIMTKKHAKHTMTLKSKYTNMRDHYLVTKRPKLSSAHPTFGQGPKENI